MSANLMLLDLITLTIFSEKNIIKQYDVMLLTLINMIAISPLTKIRIIHVGHFLSYKITHNQT